MDLASHIDELIDRLAKSPAASVAVILAFSVICLAPGMAGIPLLDGAEPGIATGAREMVETGDFATIRLQSATAAINWAARGGYWLSALAAATFGSPDSVWAYRVPSLISGILIPVFTWWVAIAVLRRRGALLAGVLIAAMGIVGFQSRMAMPDALLVAATTLGAGFLVRSWRVTNSQRWSMWAAGFWSAVAVAFLIKGPAAPGALMATAGVLWLTAPTRRNWPRSWVGAGLVGAALALWLAISLYALAADNFVYLADDVRSRLGIRSIVGAPPGSYLLFSSLLIGPLASFLYVGVSWFSRNLSRPAIIFSLAWATPIWLMAEFSTDKLPYLILPAVPAIAVLIGEAIDRGGSAIKGWISWFFSLGLVAWPAIAMGAMPAFAWYFDRWIPWWALLWLISSTGLGALAWAWLRQKRVVAASVVAVLSSMLLYWSFFAVVLPGFGGLRISERILATSREAVGCEAPDFTVAGYPEESMVFVLGRSTRLADANGAADFLDSSECRVAAVERGQIPSFRQHADDLGLDLVDHAQITGINLRRLRVAEMHVFTLKAAVR